MSISRISICYNSVILLFLVSLLVHLSKSQRQTTSTSTRNYNCSTFGQSCVSINDCPNATQIIQSGKGRKCGFTDDKPTPAVKICCNITNASTVRVKEMPGSRNGTAVAIQKCQEYGNFRYKTEWKPPQTPAETGFYRKKQDCLNIHTLIIGGAPAQVKEYPHMALIGYGEKFGEVEWGCGGSLISERFVMSAAHCGKTSAIGPPKWALLGDLILSRKDESKSVTYSIINIYDHPQYVSTSSYHDISLFELNTTVQMSPYIRPACLHTSMTELAEGIRASVSGWGKIDSIARGISDKLLKAAIKTVSDRTCKIFFPPGNSKLIRGYDSNTMICAGDLKDGNDTCQGDSGGPLQILIPRQICMWDIVGVTSFGPSPCGSGDPGVYTKVAYYLDWIQSIVWP